jgi:fructuronate reductase
LKEKQAWADAGVRLPRFDWQAMRAATLEAPVWVHFGAGNIFRAFIARLQQALLEQGLAQKGILAAETFDYDIIDRIYAPFDSMALMVTLRPDGSMEREVVASIAGGAEGGERLPRRPCGAERAFCNPSLQMISFTITEKGYALRA